MDGVQDHDCDVAVVGSGFGGSVAALRLAERGLRVRVFERGRRLQGEDFAETNWNLRRYLWMPRLGLHGPQELTLFRRLLVLTGSGVGGGSLVYAGVLVEPPRAFFERGAWAALADWPRELAPHFATAKRMLGASRAPHGDAFDEALERIAARSKGGARHGGVDVGIHFGDAPGTTTPDPFFDGAGPDRTSCTLCGNCLVGCRVGAKNTLDKNYLHLAEGHGAAIEAGRQVTAIAPLGAGDGRDGYAIETAAAERLVRRDRRRITARAVVLAAGVLGTNRLLLHCRDVAGTLPGISARLGHGVRSNGEEIVFVRAGSPTLGAAKGVAVHSHHQPDDDTSILMTRFAPGSSLMSALGAPTALAARHPGLWRALVWSLRHPLTALQRLSPRRWAESTRGLIVMQHRSYPPSQFETGGLGRTMRLRGRSLPLLVDRGHETARELAAEVDGVAQPFATNALLHIPATAHLFGGCGMGATPSEGVVGRDQTLFGYQNFWVCDGSVLTSDVGTAPSLTITALAERAMSKAADMLATRQNTPQ